MRKHRWFTALLLFFVAASFPRQCQAQGEQFNVSLTPEQQGSVRAFAQSIQKVLKKEKCANISCKVLVVNLTISTGETCSACILLSDSLAKSLAELPDGPGVVSRISLASFMDQERISSGYLNLQDTQVWIARELRADRVVFGSLVRKGDSLQLKAKVLKHEHFGNSTETSREIRIEIPIGYLADGFAARESFHTLPKRDASQFDADTTELTSFKRQGIEPPHCGYMPNPEYTDAARAVKFSGTLLLEAIVTRQGTLVEARITRGLPYGLNQNSLKTLQKWKCVPATRNGVPLAVLVPFEVAFRLY